MKTLVVGASGLLGNAVAAAGDLRSEHEVIRALVTWSDPVAARRDLAGHLERLVLTGEPWQVIWCAGVGVNGVSQQQFDAELAQFELFLSDATTMTAGSPGFLFLTSSAGGVYAGASGPPFNENSPVAPIAPYGFAKLAMERALLDFSERTSMPVLVGRLSNLYGVGQSLTKQQGLISHLLLGGIERRPVSIFVPLDTIRDYLYVEDAAEMILDAADEVRRLGARSIVKIFASHQAMTIAAVIGQINASTGSKPPIVLGASSLARQQGRDIRLRSYVLPEIDRRALTPFVVGIARTRSSLLELYLRVGRRRL